MDESCVAFLDELSVLIDRERNRVTGQSGLDPVNALVAEMRGRCREAGLTVDPAGYVGETATAFLLGVRPQATLRGAERFEDRDGQRLIARSRPRKIPRQSHQ